ncbi:hypothetical protein AMJ49_01210 [Parcubacteria bacterium DG_74_2]|nr:MAG: hypothetical protein AMJ49_01210 [Parcubacteria bacterium DG_74_2]
MQLSKESIEEYKEIYKKVFGEEISDQEAYEQGSRLLRLFKAIYRPIPKSKAKEFKKFCKEKN